jgi:hypothetical protein
MSVIGISPSDIIAAGKVVKKAFSAVRDGGAADSFQEADGSVQDRIAAFESIEDHIASPSILTSPSSNAATSGFLASAKRLRTRDQAHLKKKKHDKLRSSLGLGTTSSRPRQAGNALKWAFKGERDLEEHNARVRPAVDATIIHGILYVPAL